MKPLLSLALILLALLSGAEPPNRNDVLVFVQQDSFNPAIPTTSFTHAYWVQWPDAGRTQGQNGVFSIATGADWSVQSSDLAFQPLEGRRWRSIAFTDLQSRGHFEVRESSFPNLKTALLTSRSGATRSEALLVALDGSSPVLTAATVGSVWPPGPLMVAASDGKDIEHLRRQTSGRILIVEYPPKPTEGWSRLWLVGSGWPDGMFVSDAGLPGLVSARDLMRLVRTPERFRWDSPNSSWPGANRWLEFLDSNRIGLWALLGTLAVVTVAVSVWFVEHEQRSALAAGMLRALALLPFSVLVGFSLARVAGLAGTYIWMLSALLTGYGLVFAWQILTGRSAWVAVALLSLGAALGLNPRYTPFNGSNLGDLFGIGFAAVALLSGELRRTSPLLLTGAILMATLVAGIGFHAWWGDSPVLCLWWVWIAILPHLPVRLPATRRLWIYGLSLGLCPGWAIAVRNGFTFAPYGLIQRSSQRFGVNLFEVLSVIASPAVLSTLLVMGAVWLFGTPFLSYQLQNAWRRSLPSRNLFMAAAAVSLGGIAYAPFLRAGLWCFLAGALLLLDELVRPQENVVL